MVTSIKPSLGYEQSPLPLRGSRAERTCERARKSPLAWIRDSWVKYTRQGIFARALVFFPLDYLSAERDCSPSLRRRVISSVLFISCMHGNFSLNHLFLWSKKKNLKLGFKCPMHVKTLLPLSPQDLRLLFNFCGPAYVILLEIVW